MRPVDTVVGSVVGFLFGVLGSGVPGLVGVDGLTVGVVAGATGVVTGLTGVVTGLTGVGVTTGLIGVVGMTGAAVLEITPFELTEAF